MGWRVLPVIVGEANAVPVRPAAAATPRATKTAALNAACECTHATVQWCGAGELWPLPLSVVLREAFASNW